MDYSVYEIADGINLSCFPGSGEESFLKVNILSQLSRECVSLNAVLPRVLLKGCFSCPDEKMLAAAMKAAGKMTVKPFSEKYGEIQATGIQASFSTASYKQAVSLICELMSNPSTRGGLLLPDFVSSVCEAYAEEISDSQPDSIELCIQEMCAYEDYAISSLGDTEDIRSINYKKLTKHYKTLLQTAPVEIVYIGSTNAKQLANEFKRGLSTLARTEVDYELGTDIRLNSVEEMPRRVSGYSDDGNERITLGYRFGEAFFDYDFSVFKLMLCLTEARLMNAGKDKPPLVTLYSDMVKGIFAVSATPTEIDGKIFEDLFSESISDLAHGSFSDEELAAAAGKSERFFAGLTREPELLCGYILSSILSGREPDIDETLSEIPNICSQDIISAAASAVLDMIFEEKTDI